MRRIATVAALLVLESICWSETTNTVNTIALENLVYLSAAAQGHWPRVDSNDLGSSISTLALDDTLHLVAVAQETARTHGEAILSSLKHGLRDNPECYAELTYKYAKYSGCPLPIKLELLEQVNNIPIKDCEYEVLYTKCLAAYELLTHHYVLTNEKVELAAIKLVEGLEKMIADEVDIARYWRLFSAIQDQIKLDPKLGQLIKKHFDTNLMNEMSEAKTKLKSHDDPNHYGVRLYHSDMYISVVAINYGDEDPQTISEFASLVYRRACANSGVGSGVAKIVITSSV